MCDSMPAEPTLCCLKEAWLLILGVEQLGKNGMGHVGGDDSLQWVMGQIIFCCGLPAKQGQSKSASGYGLWRIVSSLLHTLNLKPWTEFPDTVPLPEST